MNKQMKRFDRFIVCVLMGIVSLTFFACSNDEDEAITQVTYEMGFSSIESSSMTDLGTIERAYKKALGVTESKFTFEGSVNECDQRVKDACGSAEAEEWIRLIQKIIEQSIYETRSIYGCLAIEFSDVFGIMFRR